MSLQILGKHLATGRTADVYLSGPRNVVKLFRTWVPESDVLSERSKACIAHSEGIRTPAVGDIVRQNGRIGLMFERVEGLSMMEKVKLESDSIQPLARLLAELHLSLHTRRSYELPAQRGLLTKKVSRCTLLTPAQRDAVLDTMAHLPNDDRICHGDFHPGNVMLTDREPVIIDWIDASSGNPVGDVARTSLLFLGHIENNLTEDTQKAAMRLFHRTYLDHYMAVVPGRLSEYQRWLVVMAAARLSEGIAEQQDWLLCRVQTGLDGLTL